MNPEQNSSQPRPSEASPLYVTDQRLTDLEIKATYTEDLLEQLDKIVARQQQQIDALMREVVELRQPAGDGQLLAGRSLRDDLPPHF